MKRSLLFALAALAATTSLARATEDDETSKLDARTAPYVYEAYASKPLGNAAIAAQVSQDFRKAPDEFAQWDYFQTLLPSIQRKTKEAKETGTFQVVIGAQLGRYDFDKMGFPTEFEATTFIPLQRSGYAVKFSNTEAFAYIGIQIDEARKHQLTLRQSRQVSFVVTVKPVAAVTEMLNSESYHCITAQIVDFQIVLPSGEVLAAKKL